MLLRSDGGILRVFSGIPDAWEDVYCCRLRAEGAFLVSAKREKGRLVFIHIQSLAGEPLAVAAAWRGPITARYGDGSRRELVPEAGGLYRLALELSGEVLLTQGETGGDALGVPAANLETNRLCHYWGSFKPWRLYGIPQELSSRPEL